MSGTGALSAQIGAETRMRLRSAATPIALTAFFAASFFWIPDPSGRTVSISWSTPDGRVQSPIYTADYLGFAVAILSCIFLTLAGFYLVAGSVRRDRERGVGAILAATPLSRGAYLGGKFAANLAYLLVVAALALAAGVLAFFRYGTGPFHPLEFAAPSLFLTLPAMAWVASLAILFDVTPGLRGRGGLVVWFFVFTFGLVLVPAELAGGFGKFSGGTRPPVFDPAGFAAEQWLIRKTMPENVGDISTGHITHTVPVERVPWRGARPGWGFVALRALNLALAAAPLALAILVFDRFDPARSRRASRRLSARALRARAEAPPGEVSSAATAPMRAVRLSPASPQPSAARAVAAEARLLFETAGWLKWPLAAAAFAAGIAPGNLAPALLLLLFVPAVSEAAAREEMSGTRALVFSQPAVPRSVVLWKAASVGVFLLALGAPMAIRAFVASPIRGLACAAGLLAAAGAAVALGSLTSGGKLFTGVYLVFWYAALNGLPAADFTGTLAKTPDPKVSFFYFGAAVALVAVAMLRERMRLGPRPSPLRAAA